MKKKTIINKGNYTMEPPEREERFEAIRAMGWEDAYHEYRRQWQVLPQERHVSAYPLLVDIELSSICNLHCPMCYTITEQFKRHVNAQLMDFELFKKIIDEIGGNVPALRLSFRGEPTLHPRFIDCIRYAKSRGIGEVSFLTNGSRLSPPYFQKIMEAGADWITLSVDGIGAAYEKIRSPLKFADTFNRIKAFHAIKLKAGACKPVIKVQTIWPAIRNTPEQYYNLIAPWVDLIAFNPLIDFNSHAEGVSYVDQFYCPQHYQRLVVGADGRVMMCANDENTEKPMGDAAKESISEIWHGKRLTAMRERHQSLEGFKQIGVCRRCYLPRAVDASETATVNGRQFSIANYTPPQTRLARQNIDRTDRHVIEATRQGSFPNP